MFNFWSESDGSILAILFLLRSMIFTGQSLDILTISFSESNLFEIFLDFLHISTHLALRTHALGWRSDRQISYSSSQTIDPTIKRLFCRHTARVTCQWFSSWISSNSENQNFIVTVGRLPKASVVESVALSASDMSMWQRNTTWQPLAMILMFRAKQCVPFIILIDWN